MTKSKTQINALLEIGTEEIPARFMAFFLEDLKKKAEEKLISARVKFSKVKTFGTLRRLALYIEGISGKQEDLIFEKKGPAKEGAFDSKGARTKAAEGFAKSCGVGVKDLVVKSVSGKEYVFAKVVERGKPTEIVLSTLFPEIITSLYMPLSMRWGNLDLKFIRPIHSLFAVCGRTVVKFELGGIKSGNTIYGHRYFNGSKPISIDIKKGINFEKYEKILLERGVLVNQELRKRSLKVEVEKVAKKIGKPLIEEDLLNEINNLVEYPVAVVGSFKADYLSLPKEVLITTMKKNQKYFPILNKTGKLLPNFVVVTDGMKRESALAVVPGNERVLSARLSDAKFFFDEDKKTPLSSRVLTLKGIAFFEKLGNLFEKKERIKKLSQYIAKRLKVNQEKLSVIERTAELCKADLITHMVFEFPELQGIMGREYALAAGEEAAVAQGIYEHYLPAFAGDALPQGLEGTVVSLADRFDLLVGCFSVGLIPTGSEDPYSLRRVAHGIVEIVLSKKLDLTLEDIIEHSYKLYEPIFLEYLFKKGETGYKDYPKIRKSILDFIAARLKTILLDEGIRHDVADASLYEFDDILASYDKAKIIMDSINTEGIKGIITTADRIKRIAVSATREQIIEEDFVEETEKTLYDLYLKTNWAIGEAIKNDDYKKAIDELSKMTKPIDDFFVKVLVMHENEKLKLNRLALLLNIHKMYLEIADFSKIVI